MMLFENSVTSQTKDDATVVHRVETPNADFVYRNDALTTSVIVYCCLKYESENR